MTPPGDDILTKGRLSKIFRFTDIRGPDEPQELIKKNAILKRIGSFIRPS
jgi:hypothetical protein